MRLKKLVKHFEFTRQNYNKVELGADVRLNVDTHKLQLKEDALGEYSDAADLYAKTWVTNPSSVRQWLSFEAVVTHPVDEDGVDITALKFRLGDGVNEYWWDGGAWVINTSSWNTEAEVANNIASFPVTSKKLQVILNLSTTDKLYTPYVAEIKVLYSSDIEHHEDYVYRTIVRQLREQVRPIGDFPTTMDITGTSIDMSTDAYKLETPYNIVDIDSVFNHTDDPSHAIDLFSSYDSNTKIITLNNSLDAGKIVWIKFIWEPEVAVTTGVEYSEQSKLPVLEITDVNAINSAETGAYDSVINKDTGSAVKVPGPLQADLEFTLRGVTSSARDHVRLATELLRFFRNNPVVSSHGMDEEFRLWLLEEYNADIAPNRKDLHTGKIRFLLVKALFFEREAIDAYAVQSFSTTGNMEAIIT